MPMEPLRFDWSGAQFEPHGLTVRAMEHLAPKLDACRHEVMETDVELFRQGNVPVPKQPLDAGFIPLPERLLDEYRADRVGSELSRILATARRLRDLVDRVVVLGIGGSYMGARALMQACVHPYHNELSRVQRGGIPRMYFEGDNVDNDAARGLLELLGPARDADWAIVVISKSGGTLETAAAFRVFLQALRESCGNDAGRVRERVVPVTGTSGRLFEFARELGCRELFEVPEGVGGRFSVLSAVGLLPAAILGIDVVKLLEGARAMNEHFRTAPTGQNCVLQYVGACHLLETQSNVTIRVLSVWSKALESIGYWYDQLLAESLGKQELGATPITVVNTRDLHSRAQQHQEGRRDKVMTNLTVSNYRCDPVRIGASEIDHDRLNVIATKTLPDLMRAAIESTNQSYRDDHRPTTTIQLPGTEEYSIGQLLQMLMLATAVEGRLLGINPYGQPGVEGYKRYLKSKLELT